MSRKPASNSSRNTKRSSDTSWEVIAQDYNKAVDRDGHFYHKEVILLISFLSYIFPAHRLWLM